MPALVIAAHGSHLNADASRPAQRHADAIRESGTFEEVRTAFWKEEPSYREILRTLRSSEVFVVPLFVAEGYFTERIIPRELRLEGWEPALWESDGTSAGHATLEPTDLEMIVHYCGPVGTHDAMTDVVVRRAESITGDAEVGPETTLAVVGHGTERNEHSAKATRYHVDRVRARSRFAAVEALFLDEPPEIADLTAHVETRDAVVVPLFVADGYHTREDIPADIGIADADGTYDVPATVDGHRVWYSRAVGTEPLVADVILERAADAGAAVGDGVGVKAGNPDPAGLR